MLGCRPDGVISRVFVDDAATTSTVAFTPNMPAVRGALRRWEEEGWQLAGFAHSHPAGLTQPSAGDQAYAQRLLAHQQAAELAVPIVQTLPDAGEVALHGHVARPGRGEQAELAGATIEVVGEAVPGQFDRLDGAHDVDWLAGCRLVAVGAGGARQALEDLARSGVGQLVVIDPDVVEPSNLGSQHTRRSELGRSKAAAAAEAIADLNPGVAAAAVPARVQDLGTRQLSMLLTGELPGLPAPRRSLVAIGSDSFAANAYAHRAALHHGLAAVTAATYQQGLAGEVGLVLPGVTAACLRCRAASRYAWFLDGGENPVTSQGAPLWTTTRLNAVLCSVTLAALQYPTEPDERPRSREQQQAAATIDRLAHRAHALVRMAPDAADQLGLRAHPATYAGTAHPDRLVYDDTVWLGFAPKTDCGDCGGVGDLRQLVGQLHPWEVVAADAATQPRPARVATQERP
jgi:proteasome lid subunit RPN8/RPN11